MTGVRLLAVARKEWIQLKRDPRSMVLAFALPLLLLLFFGYAITWDVKDLEVTVVDLDGTAASRELMDAFATSGYFDLSVDPGIGRQAEANLQQGRIRGILTIPAGYAKDAAARREAAVQLVLDGSDANTATIAQNAAEAIVARYNAGLGRAGRAPSAPFRVEARTWYNPNLESRNMIVPGLVAVIMSIIAAMLTALTIAREWERGTMEQLAATPVGRVEVVVGKLLPYLAIGLFDVTVTIAAGAWVFDTPMNGNLLYLASLTLLFLIGALGLGVFISAAVKSQVLATQVALVATYLPALLLSGFLYDIASMPRILQAITFLVPARYYIAVTRGILLKGVGLGVLWPQAVFMMAYAALGLGLAVRFFRKELQP
jgi:ABC-2 type transport system permease protein